MIVRQRFECIEAAAVRRIGAAAERIKAVVRQTEAAILVHSGRSRAVVRTAGAEQLEHSRCTEAEHRERSRCTEAVRRVPDHKQCTAQEL